MIITIQIDHRSYAVDFSTSYDLSIPVKHGEDNVSAWYLDRPSINPVVMDDFVGQVSQGGSTNFNSIWFNPHAHMTHTECLGHITKEFYSVNKQLKEYHFPAFLITVEPTAFPTNNICSLSIEIIDTLLASELLSITGVS